jgi:hypothetical protein
MSNPGDEGYMQQHLCTCMIDIASEKLTVLYRDESNPVPWPEVRVLQQVHGDDAIYDIMPVALGPRETPLREKERLVLRYGRDMVEAVYAGKSFNMEFFMPGWPIDPAKGRKKKPERVRPPVFRKPDAEATDVKV